MNTVVPLGSAAWGLTFYWHSVSHSKDCRFLETKILVWSTYWEDKVKPNRAAVQDFLCPRSLQSTSGAKHWTRAIKGSEKVITKQSASQFTYQLVIKVDSSTLNTLKAVSWPVVLMHASLALLWQTVGHLPLPCPAATSLSWHPRDSLGTQGTLWTQTQCCLKLPPRAPSFHSCQLRPDTAPEAPLAGSSRTCWVPGSALIFSAIPDTPPTWVECWGLHPVATGFSKNFSRPFIVHSIYFRWATGVRDVGVAKGIKLLKCSF